jgi:hypothetical protein
MWYRLSAVDTVKVYSVGTLCLYSWVWLRSTSQGGVLIYTGTPISQDSSIWYTTHIDMVWYLYGTGIHDIKC